MNSGRKPQAPNNRTTAPIGDQKDAGEFNIAFLSQINEAFQLEEEAKGTISPSKRSERLPESPPINASTLERSVSLGIPPQLSSILQKLDNTFILNNFFGNFQVISKAREKDGQLIKLESEVPFGQIMINASEKDIYEGWDTNYFNEIEDFQTPSVSKIN